jgi:hypothetical protein
MSNSRNIADIFSKSTAISTDAEVSTAVVTERTTVATLSGKTLLAPAMTNIIITPSSTTSTPITINGIASQSGDYLNINTLATGGTNIVKIDVNGNLGLGVTPSVKLDVGGQVYVRGGTSNTGAVLVITSDPTSGSNGVTLETSFVGGGAGPLIIKTNSTERMRIDNIGNVKIGSASFTNPAIFDISNATANVQTATLARYGGDNNFQLSTYNGVATNASGSMVAKIGVLYNGVGDNAMIKFYRGGSATDGSITIETNQSERFKIDGAGSMFTPQMIETATINAGAPFNGDQTIDVITNKSVTYFTGTSTNNWNLNLRGNGIYTLNSMLAVGQSLTIAYLVTNTTAYYQSNAVKIDGTTTNVTTKWQGSAPTSGNANATDVYTITVIKTASTPAYTVLASQTKFV